MLTGKRNSSFHSTLRNELKTSGYKVNCTGSSTQIQESQLIGYNTQIKNLECVLQSTESVESDNYLQSNNWITKVKTLTDIKTFPNGFLNDGEYILITAGGYSV